MIPINGTSENATRQGTHLRIPAAIALFLPLTTTTLPGVENDRLAQEFRRAGCVACGELESTGTAHSLPAIRSCRSW